MVLTLGVGGEPYKTLSQATPQGSDVVSWVWPGQGGF